MKLIPRAFMLEKVLVTILTSSDHQLNKNCTEQVFEIEAENIDD